MYDTTLLRSSTPFSWIQAVVPSALVNTNERTPFIKLCWVHDHHTRQVRAQQNDCEGEKIRETQRGRWRKYERNDEWETIHFV